MNLLKSPNEWSCLPTAFAMAMNLPLERILEMIGHDGSEPFWPGLPSPMGLRGFHEQELVDVARKHGFNPIHILAAPAYEHWPILGKPVKRLWPDWFCIERMNLLMETNIGVICGMVGTQGHAVAWDGESFYNPNGTITTDPNFMNITSFYLLGSINKQKQYDCIVVNNCK